MKRTISVLLSAILILSTQLPISAASQNEAWSYAYEEKGLYDTVGTDVYVSESFERAVLNGLESYSNRIDVSAFNVSKEDILDTYCSVLYDHGEIFYAKTGLGYYSNGSGNVTLITPKYIYDAADIPEKKQEFDVELNKAVSSAADCETDLQKALAVHDYLAVTAEYDEAALEDKSLYPDESYTAYGVLCNKTGVCQSYTLAYSAVLNRLGIECHTAQSPDHIWNVINVGGNYYHVDITFDDPVPDSIGFVEHDYFMLSDAELAAINDSTHGTSWDSSYHCGVTTYNGYWWRDAATIVPVANGSAYYLTADSKGILRVDASAVDSGNNAGAEKAVPINSLWSAGGNSYWVGCFTAMAYRDGYIYYNTNDTIYKYNILTGTNTEYYVPDIADGNSIYGVALKGDHLLYSLKPSPNDKDVIYTVPELVENQPFLYEIENNEAVVTKYVGGDVEVEIPAEFDGCPTAAIGDGAFENRRGIVTVTLPATVKTVGSNAFSGCDSLATVFFDGCAGQFADIDVSEGNADFLSAETVYREDCVNGHVPDADDIIDTVEATCTDAGYNTYRCLLCGEEFKGEEIPALGHSYEETVVEPNCTDGGYTVHKCSRCNDEYTDNETDALGHAYEDTVVEPNCTDGGYTVHKCSRCNDEYTDNETDALGHAYEETVVEPNCTDGGYTVHKCSRCNAEYTDNETDALGHAYEDTVVEPNCTDGGYTVHKCSRCNAEYTDNETDALGHAYEDTVVEPNCTDGGYTIHKCSRCNDEYTDNETDALGHAYEETVVEPNCTDGGYTVHKCSRCNDEYTDNETDAQGHAYEETVVEPNCTDGGYTVHKCSRCNAEYTDNETDALGGEHSYHNGVCSVCRDGLADELGLKLEGTYSLEITEYTGDGEKIVIPVVVDGRHITSIKADAFAACGDITDIYFTGSKEQWAEITVNDVSLKNAVVHFDYDGIEEPEYTVGDVNGDGFADTLDALFIARYDANMLTENEIFISDAADVNNDGYIDSLDALSIARNDAT